MNEGNATVRVFATHLRAPTEMFIRCSSGGTNDLDSPKIKKPFQLPLAFRGAN